MSLKVYKELFGQLPEAEKIAKNLENTFGKDWKQFFITDHDASAPIKLKRNRELKIEIIPTTCLSTGLQNPLGAKDWGRMKFQPLNATNNTCVTCGSKQNIGVYEEWIFDDKNRMQIFDELTVLCEMCNNVRNKFPEVMKQGKDAQLFNHLMTVNNWTYQVACMHYHSVKEESVKRSIGDDWSIEVTNIKKYGIRNPYFDFKGRTVLFDKDVKFKKGKRVE